MDAELLRELKQVAINAAEVQSVMFSTLWSENLTEFLNQCQSSGTVQSVSSFTSPDLR